MRLATPTDLRRINRLLAEFGRTATATDLSHPGVFVVVNDEVTAMGVLYVVRDLGRWTGHTTSLVVAPEARGQGLARKVMRELVVQARPFAPLRIFGYGNPTRLATVHILATEGWTQLAESIGNGSALWALDLT